MLGFEHLRLVRAVALVAGAFILLVQSASAHGVNPSSVVDTYERAWGEHDIDSALNQFADDATITFNEPRTRTLVGRQQIRDFLQNSSLKTEPALTSSRRVDGSTVTWSERQESRLMNSYELSVQAVVSAGKIQSLEYRRGRVEDDGRPAAGASPESAGMAFGAIVLLGLGLLSLATDTRHMITRSNMRGRLIGHLRQSRVHSS